MQLVAIDGDMIIGVTIEQELINSSERYNLAFRCSIRARHIADGGPVEMSFSESRLRVGPETEPLPSV